MTAVSRARSGEGPSLIEARAYRYMPNTSNDDDTRYRTKNEVDEWRAKDPVKRAFAYLLSAGVTEQELEKMRAGLADEIEKAITQAESEPDPRPEDTATHVYAADNPLPDGTRA